MTADQNQDDVEKIEAAANEFANDKNCEPWNKVLIHQQNVSFKAGVQWRDKNPSPAVAQLVETLRAFNKKFSPGDNWFPEMRDALAAYEESLK